jgi:DNA-binding Lrp family transcriptional regulator
MTKNRSSDIPPFDWEASNERQRQIEEYIAAKQQRLGVTPRPLAERIEELERAFAAMRARKAS